MLAIVKYGSIHACGVDDRNEYGFNDGSNGVGDVVGDGDQLLSTAGQPLHHLLVRHQRQFSPSEVHVPPDDDGDEHAMLMSMLFMMMVMSIS